MIILENSTVEQRLEHWFSSKARTKNSENYVVLGEY